MDDYCVYRLKVTLKGIRPPIWRRLAVPGEISLRRLHQTLQTAFGWQDYHLHEFIIDGTVYGLPDREAEMMGFRKVRDDRRVKLKAVVSVRDKFLYRYDLGDNWEHEIQVEDIELGQKQERPVCLGGRRAAPPEDCGGLSGYTDLLDALGDPEHPEHESYVEWLGGVFDPEAFDLAAVNQRLAEIRVAPRSSR
ncbi:MAG TPA: plasmid pRiA4b ORF-3 family protein [Firmicutes bacterium]|nr:plasmid pRiA4b ORF-3 family protein [Bacillota bacterium]